jgi:hypothetical protein
MTPFCHAGSAFPPMGGEKKWGLIREYDVLNKEYSYENF